MSVKIFGKSRSIISGPASILTDIELQSFAAQLHAKKIGKINGGRVGIAIILNLLDSPKNFHLIQVIATQCIKIGNHEIDFLQSEDKDTIHKFEYVGLYVGFKAFVHLDIVHVYLVSNYEYAWQNF